MGKKCLEKEPQVAIQDLDSNVSENMMEVDGDHGDKSHGSLLPKGLLPHPLIQILIPKQKIKD